MSSGCPSSIPSKNSNRDVKYERFKKLKLWFIEQVLTFQIAYNFIVIVPCSSHNTDERLIGLLLYQTWWLYYIGCKCYVWCSLASRFKDRLKFGQTTNWRLTHRSCAAISYQKLQRKYKCRQSALSRRDFCPQLKVPACPVKQRIYLHQFVRDKSRTPNGWNSD